MGRRVYIMSGICGVVRLDGRAASSGDVGVLLTGLHQRGPDRSGAQCSGPAGLGHALLATTPEGALEPMPFSHTESGCIITADVRLDNRGELIAALGIDPKGRVIGDGELILRAYLKWDTACTSHLLGDFAFAIWDARLRRLFAARDHTGMRQLIHHHRPGHLFTFASQADALARHTDIPSEINELRIADYLEEMESADLTSTFFKGTHRLPPAHALTLDDGRLRIWRYWHPDPPQRLHLPSDEAYAEALRTVLSEAVAARLRSPDPVGAMLSGGMDSGSVAALSAQVLKQQGAAPLATFSGATSDPGCIESRAIRLAQTIDHIDPHTIYLEDMAEYGEELARLTWESSEPFDGYMVMVRAVYLAAYKAGRKVVLDGVSGDVTLASDNMVAFHLRRGRIGQAWREAVGEARFWGETWPAGPTFINGARHAFVPEALRDLRRRLSYAHRQRTRDAASPVAPELGRRVNLHQRRDDNEASRAFRCNGLMHDRRVMVLHPDIVAARERYDRTASQVGIEARDPFRDIRVIALCLSMPDEQLQQNGWPKTVLRRAAAGLLPDDLRWRVGKEHVGYQFALKLAQDFPYQTLDGMGKSLARYVKAERFPAWMEAASSKSSLAKDGTLHCLPPWVERLTSQAF